MQPQTHPHVANLQLQPPVPAAALQPQPHLTAADVQLQQPLHAATLELQLPVHAGTLQPQQQLNSTRSEGEHLNGGSQLASGIDLLQGDPLG